MMRTTQKKIDKNDKMRIADIQTIGKLIKGQEVWAHNSDFDTKVLTKAFGRFSLPFRNYSSLKDSTVSKI